MLIDTHAHLDYSEFEADLDDVLRRAEAAGVTRIITIGTSVESSHRAVALAEKYPQVYAVVGVHPTNAADAGDDVVTPLRALAQHPRVVAIGETGLDYHHLPSEGLEKSHPVEARLEALGMNNPVELEGSIADGAWKNAQMEIFQQQLDLAVELGLNVVIHQRDAWTDTVDILRSYTGRVRGVFHCFGNDPEQAEEVIALGHLVSFTGIVTFKNAQSVRDTAAAVGSGKYMVETDCPYLAPGQYRGQRCEPAYTRLVAEAVAAARSEPFDTVAVETTATAERFFRFPVT